MLSRFTIFQQLTHLPAFLPDIPSTIHSHSLQWPFKTGSFFHLVQYIHNMKYVYLTLFLYIQSPAAFSPNSSPPPNVARKVDNRWIDGRMSGEEIEPRSRRRLAGGGAAHTCLVWGLPLPASLGERAEGA